MVSLRAPCEDAQEESAPSITQKRLFHKAKNKNIIFKATGFVISRETPFLVIPAKVPRQARDPESFDVAQDPEVLEGLVEWAGIQCFQIITNSLYPGFHRGDGLL
jgi:hypothetical protein